VTNDATADFIKAAKALNEAGDRELRKAVYKSFRTAALPLGQAMVEGLAEAMPKRGGLSDRVRGAKPAVRNATTGSNPRVMITFRLPPYKNPRLKAMDEGELRHPIFVRQGEPRKMWRWTSQSVPAGGASKAFEAGAPGVRAIILRDLTFVVDETARKGSS
jgi:hypothetical protein